jgi:hypothetical protein
MQLHLCGQNNIPRLCVADRERRGTFRKVLAAAGHVDDGAFPCVEAAPRIDRRFKIGHREICPAACPGCIGPTKALSIAPRIVSGSPLFVR